MHGNESQKKFFADAWFEDLKRKIDVLPELKEMQLNNRVLKEEAYILCIVYLDQLSNRFQKCNGVGKWRFCDLLINYSKISFFKKFHFQQLLSELQKELKRQKGNKKAFVSIFEKLIKFFNSKDCKLSEDFICKNDKEMYLKLYDKAEMKDFLKNIVHNEELELLIKEIDKGRGSIASLCYEKIRCIAIHQYKPSNWTIGKDEINFETLHDALGNIYRYIREDYNETGQFLGYESGEHPFSK